MSKIKSLNRFTAQEVLNMKSDLGREKWGHYPFYNQPDPTANQPARVHHVAYPTVAYSDTTIVNFPDEAEHLVTLYAAIKATEFMMLSEEDMEVYGPQLQALQQDYGQGLQMLLGPAAMSAKGEQK